MRAICLALLSGLVFGSGAAMAQHGPERLCVAVEGTPGSIGYKNLCNHCVSVKLELTNSDGDPDTQVFEVPAKTTHSFDSSNYPRVRVPFVDACAASDASS